MSRHAQVAFAAATALLAGGSLLYSCTTAKVESATPESKRAINAHAEQMLNDGREIFRFDTFGTLLDVVNHYDRHFGLRLSEQERADLIEYLKSI